MKNTLNGELRKYFREIRHLLPYYSKQSGKMMKELRYSIDDYLANSSRSCMKDILAEFGSPEEIASSYAYNIDPKILKAKLSFKKYVIIGVMLFLLFYITVTTVCVNNRKDT